MEVIGARGLWPAETDATQLESALANLAINARDAMPDGGRLVIETRNVVLDGDFAAQNPDVKPGDYVMLAVSDTGTGIAPEHLPHVVEPFFTTKAPGKGSGLGLSMVYGFVKQSRGHMKVYSEVGHGTVVRLYFPRAAVAAESAAPGASVPHAATAQAELVLVVEDNAEVRHTAITHLTDLGYRTLAAAGGKEAIEILARTPEVDVVFTDVVMPGGMTGWELGEKARRLRPDIRILYTSGFSEASVQDGRAHVAASHFLGKPYRKHELAHKLRLLLGEG
jgi:CheY-like chemotaxis protein